MSFLSRFRRKPPVTLSSEHSVITHLPLSDDDYGTPAEREAIHAFEARITAAVLAIGGEHDGDEFGGGEAMLFTYGPDADRVFAAITGSIEDFAVPPGAYAIKRYGPPADPDTREVRAELTQPPEG